MSTSFSRTREQFSRMVLRKLKILASGGSDVSADMDIVYEALDLRLKEMHRRGTFWRKVEEVGAGFTVGTVISASITADILFPIAMTLKDGSEDEPVSIVGILEWNAISNKTETGTPTMALWKGGAEFLFHPIRTSSASGTLIYQRIVDDTSASAAPDVEVSMLRWMKDIVAYDVADDFYQSEATIERFAREAEIAERRIRALGSEHKALSTVKVDYYDDTTESTETDYGR